MMRLLVILGVTLTIAISALAGRGVDEVSSPTISSAQASAMADMYGGNDKRCGDNAATCDARTLAAWAETCAGFIYTACDTCNSTGPLCMAGACNVSATLKSCVPETNQTCTGTTFDCGQVSKGWCSGIQIGRVADPVCDGGWWVTCQGTICTPTGQMRACVSGFFCSIT